MITLYSKDFSTKYGVISSLCEAFVEEERNGLFELSFIMLNTDSLFNYIKEDNIVVANANDTLLNQKFRIYMTRKLMNNRVEVFARHISFDLMYDYIDNLSFENQSCEYALNQLFRNSNFSTHYRGYSDIVNAQNYNMSMANVLEAIGGKEGSIIDTFGTGAEILRDNENIHVLNKRGYDNEVSIEYRKNLTGFELEEDTTDLITRILPYAKYNDENNGEVIVKADYVDSPLIANYSHPYIKAIDYSDKFKENEIPTVSKLQDLARKEYRDNKVDIPKQNFKVEFIPLSKCVGYEGLEDKISLCDIVTVIDTRYNINTQAKIIKTVFNVLKNRYESMELGEPRTSLGDIVGNGGDNEPIVGPPGPQGPPGQDGSIGDFPNSLPSVPIVTATVYGFANIEISWTFENKVYYQYEVYASKEVDFIPNTFNLIHQGQTSSFMYQAKPNETWYFKVCCVNSHGERTSFGSAYAITSKVSDLSNYVSEMAIDDALIGNLRLDRGWIGRLNANLLDVKGNFSVTDGNGKRTIDIDSFGNVNIDANNFTIKGNSVAQEEWVNTKISNVENGLRQEVDNNYTSKSVFNQTVDSFVYRFENTGYNLLKNSSFKNDLNYWGISGNVSDGSISILDSVGHFAFKDDNINTIQIFMQNKSNKEFGIKQNVNLVVGKVYSIDFSANGVDCGWGSLILENNGRIEHVLHFNPLESGGGFNNWMDVDFTFTATAENYTVKIVLKDAGNNGHMWIAKPNLVEGYKKVWTPNPNELYGNVIKMDKEGLKITHSDNSKGVYDAKGITYYNSQGVKTSAISDGRFSTIDNEGNVIGYTGKSVWKGTDTYLTSLDACYGSTVGLGATISGNGDTVIPLVVASQGMLIGDTWMQQGLNIFSPRTFEKQTFFRKDIGIESVTMEQYADDLDYGVIVGSNGVNMGVIHDNKSNIGFCIEKNLDYYTKCIVQCHTDLNMNNFSILNANMQYSLADTLSLNDNGIEINEKEQIATINIAKTIFRLNQENETLKSRLSKLEEAFLNLEGRCLNGQKI